MKTEHSTSNSTRAAELGKFSIYIIAVLAVLLVGYVLVHAMRAYVPKPALNAKRAEERTAARLEVNANAEKELRGQPAILNAHNGVVRLPIDRAMELTIQGQKNPAAFRSNLLARVENATKPPPKAPEKPSAFE